MKFEEKLKELDKIIEMLQNQDIEIDKAMELYQKGVKLNEECSKELEELKLSIHTVDGEELKF
ncbi:MAG: exodeoxyribonuclease VII small subunit [Peptostreptococcaceae bacterium]|nr:exodeoxyribonuclease VII small subunit [Peptostreptococcaceae bacterium]